MEGHAEEKVLQRTSYEGPGQAEPPSDYEEGEGRGAAVMPGMGSGSLQATRAKHPQPVRPPGDPGEAR